MSKKAARRMKKKAEAEHASATKVLLEASFTTNGGDIRDDVPSVIRRAVLVAFEKAAREFGILSTWELRLRSVPRHTFEAMLERRGLFLNEKASKEGAK